MDAQAHVITVLSETDAEDVISIYLANGYYRQDGDGLSIIGTFIGYVLAKFDPGNVAYDFVIVSIIPD